MLFSSNTGSGIQVKNEATLATMRAAGRLASECLAWILPQVTPGMCTLDVDDLQMQFAKKHRVAPAPLGYKGFPRSICTSINNVICHGIPSKDVVLHEGDIIGIDVTLIVDGMHGDNAATIPVGEVDDDVMKLLVTTLESQRRGVLAVRPGARVGDIGAAIQDTVEPHGYTVVRDFVGHGIGKRFHEEPQIPHYGTAGKGFRLRERMTFTIEPMINQGVPDVEVQDDGWTALTVDGSLSAQFEHTLEVTSDGVRVLTVQNDEGAWEPPGRWYPPGWQAPQTTG
jgi:methionyl aminopeptidase